MNDTGKIERLILIVAPLLTSMPGVNQIKGLSGQNPNPLKMMKGLSGEAKDMDTQSEGTKSKASSTRKTL